MKDFQFFFFQMTLLKVKYTTLFTKHVDSDILIVQIYVDDIIFESTNEIFAKSLNHVYRMSLKCL